MQAALLSGNGGALGLSLVLALLAVAAIGLAVVLASRGCETNAAAAHRVQEDGEPVAMRVPRARAVRL